MGKRLRHALLGTALAASIASSGCFQYCPGRSHLITRRFWNPALMLKKKNGRFRFKRVLVSALLRMPLICTNTAISKFVSVREKTEKELRKYLSYLDYMNLKNPRVVAMLENNIFLPDYTELKSGRYAAGRYTKAKPHGFLVSESDGSPLKDYAYSQTDFDFLILHEKNSDPAYTMIHELLHDAWESVLPQEKRRSFLGIARKLLDIGGSSKETEEMFGSHDLKLRGIIALGSDFLNQHPSGISGDDEIEMEFMILWYLKLRKFIAEKAVLYKYYPRARFIENESYTFLLPFSRGLLDEFYAPILSEMGMKKLRNDFRSRYLSSWKSVQAMIPVLEGFVKYMKSRTPAYWKKIENIKSKEDLERYYKSH